MKLMKNFWRRKNDFSFSPQLENRKIKFSSNLSTRLSQTKCCHLQTTEPSFSKVSLQKM